LPTRQQWETEKLITSRRLVGLKDQRRGRSPTMMHVSSQHREQVGQYFSMSLSGPRGWAAPHRQRIGAPNGTLQSLRPTACRFPLGETTQTRGVEGMAQSSVTAARVLWLHGDGSTPVAGHGTRTMSTSMCARGGSAADSGLCVITVRPVLTVDHHMPFPPFGRTWCRGSGAHTHARSSLCLRPPCSGAVDGGPVPGARRTVVAVSQVTAAGVLD
jgi:hypothetical protein